MERPVVCGYGIRQKAFGLGIEVFVLAINATLLGGYTLWLSFVSAYGRRDQDQLSGLSREKRIIRLLQLP